MTPRDWRELWMLDPEIVFLNHGSFGATPRAILEFQREIRDRIEREPVRFFVHHLEGLMDAVRHDLAAFLHADASDLAFVSNATGGVNAVLRSLALGPSDELIVTDHAYNACRNALDFVSERSGATVVVATLGYPIASPEAVIDGILERVTPRTRLALVEHITSQTGVVFPIVELVRALDARGVDALVDGAHGPGMVPVDLEAIGAAYYTGNCHKWICAPKGAGFLHVRRDRQAGVRPTVISHGANTPRPGRSRFLVEFDWTGTDDPSAVLCIGECIRFLGGLLPGGWPELMAHNRDRLIDARRLLIARTGLEPAAPEHMLGTLASFRLPDGSSEPPETALYADPLQDALFDGHRIEVPVIAWPGPPRRLIRISSQLYNTLADTERLADALWELVGDRLGV